MNKLSFFIPLSVFVVVLGVGYLGFSITDRTSLPSALIGQPFPEFQAPDLFAPEIVHDKQRLLDKPTLVNVWATWCPTCKAEHEFLMQIARSTDLYLVGMNYKDDRAKAVSWISDYGNPYDFIMMDLDGSLGVELGVYGAPETFLLNPAGEVIYKRVGDVNARIWEEEFVPRLRTLEVSLR